MESEAHETFVAFLCGRLCSAATNVKRFAKGFGPGAKRRQDDTAGNPRQASDDALLVARAARVFCSRLLQVRGQVRLLQGTQLDTSVDSVLGVSQGALAAWKVLRRKKVLRIVAQFVVTKKSRKPG